MILIKSEARGLFKKRKASDPRKIDTFIGKETKMSGSLNAKGTIRIDGDFEGEILSQGDVIIGGEAQLKARVAGRNVTLGGRVEGDVRAENKLEILNKGELFGNIHTGTLAIEEGGYFTGLCNMTGSNQKDFAPSQESQGEQAADLTRDGTEWDDDQIAPGEAAQKSPMPAEKVGGERC